MAKLSGLQIIAFEFDIVVAFLKGDIVFAWFLILNCGGKTAYNSLRTAGSELTSNLTADWLSVSMGPFVNKEKRALTVTAQLLLFIQARALVEGVCVPNKGQVNNYI